MARETRLLCFDEFQVTDVADAVILSGFLKTLFESGTVMVATSNRPIADLYMGGVNREYFLPALDMIRHHCVEFDMESDIDYRVIDEELDYFYVNSNDDGGREVEAFVGGGLGEVDVEVGFGRRLCVKKGRLEAVGGEDGGAALFSFQVRRPSPLCLKLSTIPPLFTRVCVLPLVQELCNNNLGAGDYRSIAGKFKKIGVTDIPELNLKDHNQARRFITLVDELYEGRVKLACSAVSLPRDLFEDGSKVVEEDDLGCDYNVGTMKWLDVRQATGRTVGELASVRELRFAFKRAASRLVQMCGEKWHGSEF